MALISCPECKSRISDKAVACPKCRSTLELSSFCPECNTQTTKNDESCPDCGCHLNDSLIKNDICDTIPISLDKPAANSKINVDKSLSADERLIRCPRCKSNNAQKLSILYGQQVSSIQGDAQTIALGLSMTGDVGVSAANTKITATSNTLAAKEFAPPSRPKLVAPANKSNTGCGPLAVGGGGLVAIIVVC